MRLIDRHLFPQHGPVLRVERDQAAVDHADEDLAIVCGDAAVHHVAAGLGPERLVDLGVVDPALLASRCIQGVHKAPRRRDVHDAVDHEWCRLGAARRLQFIRPRQTERRDRRRRDRLERAEALLVVRAAVREPVARLAIRGKNALRVHRSIGCAPLLAPDQGRDEQQDRQSACRHERLSVDDGFGPCDCSERSRRLPGRATTFR